MSFKIYPSSYAFPQGATTNPQYNSGCLRFQKYRGYLLGESDIPEVSKAIGFLGELRVQLELEAKYPDEPIIRENPFKYEYLPDIWISGRYDFQVGDNMIVEVKTTKSKHVRSEVINKGNYSKDHLGQLLTYMYFMDISKGALCVQYVHWPTDRKTLNFIPRWFHVEIIENRVHVDGICTGYTHDYYMQFYSLTAQAYLDSKLPPKPSNPKACHFCPFASICHKSPTTPKEFIDGMAELEYTPKTYSSDIPCHNTRKK